MKVQMLRVIASATSSLVVAAVIAAVSLGLFGISAPVAAANAGPIIYVTAQAPAGGNGQDWAQAYANLQDALAAAAQTSGAHQIWVATGTYKPGTNSNASFKVTDQTSVYGGFAGNETSFSQRNIAANPTTLSGDLAGNASRFAAIRATRRRGPTTRFTS